MSRVSVVKGDPGYLDQASKVGAITVLFDGRPVVGTMRLVQTADEEQRRIWFHLRHNNGLVTNENAFVYLCAFVPKAHHVNADQGLDAVALFEEEGDVTINVSPQLREKLREAKRRARQNASQHAAQV